MRILWATLTAIVLVPLAGGFYLIMSPVWRDNARLNDLRERVLAHPLPPNTSGIYPKDPEATFGKNLTGGSGDYCDYRVRLTLQTALSEEEIRTYFREAKIPGAVHQAQISLFFEEEGDAGGRRVIVEVYDSHDSDWDWRCI
ncbi:hypothetical protein ACFWY5_03295 [Nonomuraea sp. NPDC059007]|uniref:hypothetical protein n=1 Tax=Nonomuraea sp. NPDC059007 TaxID=3346692 RepID=UPI00367BACAC